MTTTPFEDTGTLTSEADGRQWLSDLAASVATVRERTFGISAGGLPLQMGICGWPVAPTWDQLRRRPVMIVVAGQHGLREPAPSESARAILRDIAETTDPAVQSFMRRHALVVIPGYNADGLSPSGSDFLNANGTELNNDHVLLVSPETRALADVVRWTRPAMLSDHHEFANQTGEPFAQTIYGTHPQIRSEVQNLAIDAHDNHIVPAVTGAGYTHQDYPGGLNEGILRQASGLKHTLSYLSETLPEEGTLADRVDVAEVMMRAWFDYWQDNSATIEQARLDARASARSEGRLATAQYDFGNGTTVQPPPAAYTITSAQETTADDQISKFGIVVRPQSGGGDNVIDMGQHTQPLIPLVLDASGDNNVVSATSQSSVPALAGSELNVRTNATDRTSSEVRVGGQSRPSYLRQPYE